MAEPPVWIVDQLTALPGQGRAAHDAYLADYVPAARQRGMTLTKTLVSPPLWLDDGSNLLVFLWRVEGATGFWRKNNLGRRDPAVQAFWARLDAMLESRRRDTLADPADFTALADA